MALPAPLAQSHGPTRTSDTRNHQPRRFSKKNPDPRSKSFDRGRHPSAESRTPRGAPRAFQGRHAPSTSMPRDRLRSRLRPTRLRHRRPPQTRCRRVRATCPSAESAAPDPRDESATTTTTSSPPRQEQGGALRVSTVVPSNIIAHRRPCFTGCNDSSSPRLTSPHLRLAGDQRVNP